VRQALQRLLFPNRQIAFYKIEDLRLEHKKATVNPTAIAKRQELSPGAGDTVCAVTLTFMPPLC